MTTWVCEGCWEIPKVYAPRSIERTVDLAHPLEAIIVAYPVRCSTPGCRYNTPNPPPGWVEEHDDSD
jgi:hypothetical protein